MASSDNVYRRRSLLLNIISSVIKFVLFYVFGKFEEEKIFYVSKHSDGDKNNDLFIVFCPNI